MEEVHILSSLGRVDIIPLKDHSREGGISDDQLNLKSLILVLN